MKLVIGRWRNLEKKGRDQMKIVHTPRPHMLTLPLVCGDLLFRQPREALVNAGAGAGTAAAVTCGAAALA